MITETEVPAGFAAPRPTAPASLAELRSAAEAGDRRAQYRLGVAFEEGRGVPANTRRAVRWYRLAAQQDDADAQLALLTHGRLKKADLVVIRGAASCVGASALQIARARRQSHRHRPRSADP